MNKIKRMDSRLDLYGFIWISINTNKLLAFLLFICSVQFGRDPCANR